LKEGEKRKERQGKERRKRKDRKGRGQVERLGPEKLAQVAARGTASQRGLGLTGSIHEEANLGLSYCIQSIFKGVDTGSPNYLLVQHIPSINHSIRKKYFRQPRVHLILLTVYGLHALTQYSTCGLTTGLRVLNKLTIIPASLCLIVLLIIPHYFTGFIKCI